MSSRPTSVPRQELRYLRCSGHDPDATACNPYCTTTRAVQRNSPSVRCRR